MRKRIAPSLAIVVALMLGLAGCSDPAASDEYQTLEDDLASAQQEQAAMQEDLEKLRADLAEAESELAVAAETLAVPEDILTLLEEWDAANQAGDGSVVDLYFNGGYHHDGTKRVTLDELADHLELPAGWEAKWLTPPFVITDDGDGRYVVTRGLRLGSENYGYTSAFTFEIDTRSDGTMGLVHTAWAYAH